MLHERAWSTSLLPVALYHHLDCGIMQEADAVMADIRLQLARYAQGIHWVQKNFLLDESITAFLVTCGPSGPTDCPDPHQALGVLSPKTTHVILQMAPEFETPFAAPDSWNMQACHHIAACMSMQQVVWSTLS